VDPPERERATSLRRGLELLLALGGDDAVRAGGLGVVRLAEIVASDKSRVSRTLRTLGEYGLVERDEATLAYRLGWRLYALAARAADARLLDAAPPLLRRLVAEQGERVHLSVLDGPDVLTVLSEAPGHAVQAAGWIGRTVPAASTSAGRALLLDHDRASLRSVVGDGPFAGRGPNVPPDVDAVHARIVAARARGWVAADEEFEVGLVAVAAPVRDVSGRIVAAVNLSAPKFRLGDALEAAGEATKRVADELSSRLGHGTADADHRAADGDPQSAAP
jgi:DNA-binding IclR family transcriptional regulator